MQVPVELVSKEKYDAWLQGQDPRTQQLLAFKVRRVAFGPASIPNINVHDLRRSFVFLC